MSKILPAIRNFLLDLLFPLECLNCRREGAHLCNRCFREIKFNDKNNQAKLKINLKVPALDNIAIAGDYENALWRLLITKYKYNFIEPLGLILTRFLIEFWNSENWKPDYVIPIPLSKKRLRWRGFNQAEIIAREFSSHFNYELTLDLKRERHGVPQASLSESERLANMESAFVWTGRDLNGCTILLIDDVVTTGATLNEAARTLRAAGASRVCALVLAKG
ncbi:MAG: ComF family protein [Patescibacteria group bacterium]